MNGGLFQARKTSQGYFLLPLAPTIAPAPALAPTCILPELYLRTEVTETKQVVFFNWKFFGTKAGAWYQFFAPVVAELLHSCAPANVILDAFLELDLPEHVRAALENLVLPYDESP